MLSTAGPARVVASSLILAVAACGGYAPKSTRAGGSYPSYQPYSPTPLADRSSAGAPGMAVETVMPVPGPAPLPTERPGLGTAWGEEVWSPVTTSPFVRASAAPWATAVLHYNDREGVLAHASYLGAAPAPLEVYAGDGSIGISLVDENGSLLPGIHAAGRALIAGDDGARYRIVVRNGTSARFEIVASVDGLDVIDGKPAGTDRRGYLVDPFGTLVIDGFRTSDSQVAAFRFGKVAESYAAQTSGDRNVGVVGLAIFAERGAVWTPAELHRRDTADPFPAGRAYATPPSY
jgi:hypothetical protein